MRLLMYKIDFLASSQLRNLSVARIQLIISLYLQFALIEAFREIKTQVNGAKVI